MPNDIHCPNPACKHLFPAAATAGVAALVCPQCGGIFQIRRASGHKADQVEMPSTSALRPALALPTGRASRRTAVVWFAVGLMVFLTLGLLTAAFYRQRATLPMGQQPYRSKEHNYSVRLPEAPWQRDADLAKRVGGVMAFRREHPDAAVVLAVRDYPKYVPTATELRDEAVVRLRKLPIEKLAREEKPGGATFAGRPAGRFVFQGVLDGAEMSGDVQFLSYQGAAYWLYRWCPAAAVREVEGDLAELADRFAFLDLRPDWQPPRKTFVGRKLPYSLTAEGDRWDKAPYPPQDYDPAADLALIGQPQPGIADPLRQAQVLVLLLPAGEGDAIARARSHILERHKADYPESTASDIPPKTAPKEGLPAKLVTMRITNTPDRERFVVLGVAPRADGPLVIWEECDFARRELWETDFQKLVASYEPPP
jgi:hypothetical protein